MRISYTRFFLFAFAFAGLASISPAQNVGSYVHAKIQNFQQDSSAAPVANATSPFQFGSLVGMGTANIMSGTLTFSGTSSPRSYTLLGSGDMSILDTFPTLAALNGAYGSGNYTLNVVTDAGTFSKTLLFFPFSFPTTPMITAPAASWSGGALQIDAAADYTFTWNTFTGGLGTDGIELIIREAGITVGPMAATTTSYTLPAGSLDPATTYTCDIAFLRGTGTTAADPNFGQGFGALVKDTSFMLQTATPAFVLQSAVSRKTHGVKGDFDVDLPLTGTPGVECRTGGANGDHTIIVTFNNGVVSGNASVTGGTGSVNGAPVFADNTMTISLTGVANAQTVTVTLNAVTDEFSQMLPDSTINASFLLADSGGNGVVNASDVSQTKSRVGQAVDATNFRSDANANGTLNASDVAQAKANVGSGLP